MYGLDMSEAFDDSIMSTFQVIRRSESLVLGRSQISEFTFDDVMGTVCAASPNDLLHIPEASSFSRALSIVSEFVFKGVEAGFQPDMVLWRGSRYLVKHIDLYPEAGDGFYQIIAVSTESLDPAINAAEEN